MNQPLVFLFCTSGTSAISFLRGPHYMRKAARQAAPVPRRWASRLAPSCPPRGRAIPPPCAAPGSPAQCRDRTRRSCTRSRFALGSEKNVLISSATLRLTRSSRPETARPSMVVIDVPSACNAGTRQLFTRSPLTRTEQAPHSPSPQPSLTLVSRRSSRRTSSSRPWRTLPPHAIRRSPEIGRDVFQPFRISIRCSGSSLCDSGANFVQG